MSIDRRDFLRPVLLIAALAGGGVAASDGPEPLPAGVERVTTAVPFPRGLAIVDDRLHVLCRGRTRGAGGVTAAIDDEAGTIYVVDPHVAEPVTAAVSSAVADNGVVLTRPTSPPFRLWDRSADPPQRDHLTDRPYCTLRYDDATRSFYLCGFSGIDRARHAGDPIAFSKNRTDALLRYDLRTARWYEVERHDHAAGDRYPHHDPQAAHPPHGWLAGPDNCLVLGDRLYAVAKDNSRLVAYDLRAIAADPEAGPPPSTLVLDGELQVDGVGAVTLAGHSALAYRDGWLYIGTRTCSRIVRIALDDRLRPLEPIRGQLVARFDPYDPRTHRSANITDLGFDDAGRLYVLSAEPARIHRFRPDPESPYDGRTGRAPPWIDLAAEVGDPAMKSENLLAHEGWLYVTAGNAYAAGRTIGGVVYRIAIRD